MIKNTAILIILLMISFSGLTLSPPKQAWAISEGTASVFNNLIDKLLPMVEERLIPEDESQATGNPPSTELPAPIGPGDPCADPDNADLCFGTPSSGDPCANPGPEFEGLCGGYQPDTLPYGSNALPYDPMLAMQQYWANFELQLSYLAPQYQQAVLSDLRLMIEQGLAQYPPEQQQEALQMLQQTMSPGLSEAVLPT